MSPPKENCINLFIKSMSCPITKECSNLNEEHLTYLHSLTTPEAIVWGNEDGNLSETQAAIAY